MLTCRFSWTSDLHTVARLTTFCLYFGSVYLSLNSQSATLITDLSTLDECPPQPPLPIYSLLRNTMLS